MGTTITPPPSPVKEPRKPAKKDPIKVKIEKKRLSKMKYLD